MGEKAEAQKKAQKKYIEKFMVAQLGMERDKLNQAFKIIVFFLCLLFLERFAVPVVFFHTRKSPESLQFQAFLLAEKEGFELEINVFSQ